EMGVRVQCCGDAHLANFGGFESPERALVFDINDFDETLPAPWEWDVKRLATSFVIAGQDREFSERVARRAVIETVRSYRDAMNAFAAMSNLDVWYSHLDVQGVLDRWSSALSSSDLARFERNIAKSRTKNSLKALNKLTRRVDGELRII